MAQQETGKPTNKVMAGTIGAALATLIIRLMDVADPQLQTALTTVFTFALGWLVPPATGDNVLP